MPHQPTTIGKCPRAAVCLRSAPEDKTRRLQLGHGDLNNLENPKEVEALAGINIVKVSTGGWHSCALSEHGDLYVWGWNNTGQLGIKQKEEPFLLRSYGIPMLIDLYDDDGKEIEVNIKDVDCGSKHTAILLEDGSVWTSGGNKYGQLGFSVKTTQLDYFKKAFVSDSNQSVICALWNTVVLS
ncbi:unnamed protein product [Leptidea sinapis]|uniref:RCC1 domain-containing protein n=1 Tax=Leptidea sinapis TaxID=189913 RepID=A0A5E4QCN0_9NEOP|nr:unnamed protein product [Leptidea sinapis]